MVTQQKMMNMHPCQRRIRKKRINQQQERNESLEYDNILIGDDVPKIINDDGLFMKDSNDNDHDAVMDDELNDFLDLNDNNYMSSNDDDDGIDNDDDEWCEINDEEDEKIYRMHGGGICFEDGTTDDIDEQEEDIVKSYYSNSFNLLEDYCLTVADTIKHRANEIFQQGDDAQQQQNLYPDSFVTVKDCSLMIRNYTSKHKITNQGELSLVLLLKKLLPSNANLPFHKTITGSYVSDVDNVLYEENLIRGVKDFDICPLNGCTVFVGDDELKFRCPSCNTNRYTNCAECTRNKKIIKNDDNKCPHHNRVV
jgi:hypothetical protein